MERKIYLIRYKAPYNKSNHYTIGGDIWVHNRDTNKNESYKVSNILVSDDIYTIVANIEGVDVDVLNIKSDRVEVEYSVGIEVKS
jgi:hypothetical protein